MLRRFALPLAMVCAVLAVAVPAHGDRSGHGRSLTVLSYNIHAGIGADGVFDLDRTASQIRRSGADVVGLQEVDVHWGERSGYVDEARRLAGKLGMSVFFAPIYDEPPHTGGMPRRQYGVAILSRFPVLYTRNHEITRLSTQEHNPRPEPAPGFAEAVVLVRGVPVHVYATHLDYRPDPGIRATQVAETLRILRRDGGSARQVLLGDFNAEPHAPELAPLFDRLRDTWAVAPGEGTGLTYPASAPESRIDYAAVSPGVLVYRTEVPASLASDHRPYLAELSVR